MKTMFFDCRYASEDPTFTKIPPGYINKTICGCGLTTVALESDENTIVAVPNISLVTNKVAQYPNKRYPYPIFGVYGDITTEDVDNYVSNTSSVKIITTYDSLYKCEKYLNKCHLIIDESDRILKYAKNKVDQINVNVLDYLLDTAKKYKKTVSFISATPIPLEYLPSWISKLDQIKMEWTGTTKVTPICMKRNGPLAALRNEILIPLRDNGIVEVGGKSFKKVIIFINSVESILKCVKDCTLEKKEIAILCSNKSTTKVRGHNTISNPNDLPKYTFITSSGFQGIDLYDKEAMSIVVSSTSTDFRMMDMLTDLKQAISRQRDRSNPNYTSYIYIYNQSMFDVSEQELLQKLEECRKNIQDSCSMLNEARESLRLGGTKTLLESETFSTYAIKKDSWELNELCFNSDKYFILNTRKQYTKGFDIVGQLVTPIIIKAPITHTKYSYPGILEKYRNNEAFSNDELECDNYKLIDSYYKKFNSYTDNPTYAASRIKEVTSKLPTLDLSKVFQKGIPYGKMEIRTILNELYEKYNYKKKAKVDDLLLYGITYEDKKVKGTHKIFIL